MENVENVKNVETVNKGVKEGVGAETAGAKATTETVKAE